MAGEGAEISTARGLEEDIAEVVALMAKAQRPRVFGCLSSLHEKLVKEKEILTQQAQMAAKPPSGPVSASGSVPGAGSSSGADSPAAATSAPDPERKKKPAHYVADASKKFTPISKFAWDQPGFSSKFITLYITLEGVGGLPEGAVSCDFAPRSFDLKVMGLGGKDYRLVKDNLFGDLDVEKCSFKIKKSRVVVKLRKVDGKYGPDNWTSLVEKNSSRKKKNKASSKDNPMAGLNDLIKDMYDSGDDNMKKIIGEAMLKSRQGGGGGGMPDMPEMPSM